VPGFSAEQLPLPRLSHWHCDTRELITAVADYRARAEWRFWMAMYTTPNKFDPFSIEIWHFLKSPGILLIFSYVAEFRTSKRLLSVLCTTRRFM
jgi:hypothetical protein